MHTHKRMTVLLMAGGVIILTSGVYGYQLLSGRMESLNDELTTLRQTLDATRSSLETFRAESDSLHVSLSDRIHENAKLIGNLADNVEGFDSKVGKLSGSVETLEKLTNTDPQLLQKYSKVYFLNENFIPADLTVIEEKYDLVNGKQVAVLSDVWPFLRDLLDAATRDGIDIMVLSGYRSFDEQGSLKDSYTVRYGTGANQFSADQGYSEHQLGTTIDFTTADAGQELSRFDASKTFTWLEEHAYRYGFVLSYPAGNTYYEYEPWHWRFVGKELASYLHKRGLSFYDLEQREIDGYLATLFDE